MSMQCTRCKGTGFLNIEQAPNSIINSDYHIILEWLNSTKNKSDHDIQVCDCCGDGESVYGIPGEHYNNEDPRGSHGPYAYNGGLAECN